MSPSSTPMIWYNSAKAQAEKVTYNKSGSITSGTVSWEDLEPIKSIKPTINLSKPNTPASTVNDNPRVATPVITPAVTFFFLVFNLLNITAYIPSPDTINNNVINTILSKVFGFTGTTGTTFFSHCLVCVLYTSSSAHSTSLSGLEQVPFSFIF